jgi:hypothetical protein
MVDIMRDITAQSITASSEVKMPMILLGMIMKKIQGVIEVNKAINMH